MKFFEVNDRNISCSSVSASSFGRTRRRTIKKYKNICFSWAKNPKNIISSAHKMGARWRNNELDRQVNRRKATVSCTVRIYCLVKTETMLGFWSSTNSSLGWNQTRAVATEDSLQENITREKPKVEHMLEYREAPFRDNPSSRKYPAHDFSAVARIREERPI